IDTTAGACWIAKDIGAGATILCVCVEIGRFVSATILTGKFTEDVERVICSGGTGMFGLVRAIGSLPDIPISGPETPGSGCEIGGIRAGIFCEGCDTPRIEPVFSFCGYTSSSMNDLSLETCDVD